LVERQWSDVAQPIDLPNPVQGRWKGLYLPELPALRSPTQATVPGAESSAGAWTEIVSLSLRERGVQRGPGEAKAAFPQFREAGGKLRRVGLEGTPRLAGTEMRRVATFRQQDVTRALRAAAGAGCEVRRVEIDRDGKIILVLIEVSESDQNKPDGPEIVL
jgi:hypothetical protein